MHEAALGILDDFGIRSRLLYLLLDKDYPIKVIGHSLGAGVAVLIAAEMRNSVYDRLHVTQYNHSTGAGTGSVDTIVTATAISTTNDEYSNTTATYVEVTPTAPPYNVTTTATNSTANNSTANSNTYDMSRSIPSLSAIAYAMPPAVSESLAQAMSADDLCVSAVNSFDIVPRFSKVSKWLLCILCVVYCCICYSIAYMYSYLQFNIA